MKIRRSAKHSAAGSGATQAGLGSKNDAIETTTTTHRKSSADAGSSTPHTPRGQESGLRFFGLGVAAGAFLLILATMLFPDTNDQRSSSSLGGTSALLAHPMHSLPTLPLFSPANTTAKTIATAPLEEAPHSRKDNGGESQDDEWSRRPTEREVSSVPLVDDSSFQQAPAVARDFSSCEKKALGWEKYSNWLSTRVETVCGGGLSELKCVTFPYHNPPRAFFCFGSNIVEERVGEGLKWTAFCKRTSVWHRRSFWDEMGVSMPLYSGGMGSLNIIEDESSRPSPPPEAMPFPFSYIARTDCPNRNPAHCMADPQLGFLIREILGYERSKSRTVLADPGMSEKYAWGTVFGAVRMSIKDAVQQDHDAAHEGGSTRMLLSHAAFSPGPMYAPHWQGSRDDKKCEGRSQILLDYQGRIYPSHFEALRSGEEGGGDGFSTGKVLLDDYCGWLAKEMTANSLSGRFTSSPYHRTVLSLAKCKDPFRSVISRWASRGDSETAAASAIAPEQSADNVFSVNRHGVVLVLTRHNSGGGRGGATLGNGRQITNLRDLLEGLADEPGIDRPIVTVNPGMETYLAQFGLVASAAVVVGMHGGALWGASRWMREDQAMIEVLPILGPGDTCMKAKMFGTQYNAHVCSECRGRDKSGAVDVPAVVKEVVSVLSRRRSAYQPDKHDTRCSEIPAMTRGR
eukprot:jgi/Bigna1/79097/fgenesh1_pg.59_\